MTQFKGTKGKWHVTPYNNVFCHEQRICDMENVSFISKGEIKANAQLIAHAPEMLEFIKSIFDDYHKGLIEDMECIAIRAEQLYTKATSL